MDSGFYASFSGLQARMQALDLIANNLANVSTNGFKSQHEFYRDVIANSSPMTLSSLNQAINDYGVLGGTAIDLSPGNFERTGNNLDTAIEGPGFFVVQTNAGSLLTRNGAFQLNAKRQLTTSSGDLVLGNQGAIQIPSGEISIGPDGTISVGGAIVDQIKMVELIPGTQPVAEGNSYFSADPTAVKPAASSQLQQGMLETSNINAVSGMVSLIDLQRHADLMQRALAIFDADFNKTAVQQLPQV